MKNFEIGAIVLGLVAGTVQAEPVQWSVADGGNGHWYEGIACQDLCTWQEARDSAITMGGDLASVNTEGENDFIFSVISKNEALWFYFQGVTVGPYIGGYQNIDAPDYSEPYGGWYWVDGSSFDSYTAWNGGEPGNSCGGLPENLVNYMGFGSPSMLWNDIGDECHGGLAGFVVEWNHNPSMTQWRIEDGGNGHWYQLVESGKGFLWSEAVAEAESRGGYLVSLTSADEDAWVYANFDADNSWIGVFQDTNAEDYSEPSGGWRWLSGETLDYSNWNGGGPDNGGVVDAPAEEYAHYCCGGAWNDIYFVDSFGVFVRKQMMVEYTTLPGSALGACCLDGLCITTAAADCSGNSGSWGGPNSSCADFDCPESCPADVDGNGDVGVSDILLLIASWGACP